MCLNIAQLYNIAFSIGFRRIYLTEMRNSAYSTLLLCLLFHKSFADLDKEWWKHTIIYEIVPFSFKDSDGDGRGDIKGITSKLDHFVDLNKETIHLTPVFETSFKDMGYDITDYCKIDSRYGTIEDFDELIREMKKRDMKLILDLVINHSGHEHEWFLKSIDRIEIRPLSGIVCETFHLHPNNAEYCEDGQ